MMNYLAASSSGAEMTIEYVAEYHPNIHTDHIADPFGSSYFTAQVGAHEHNGLDESKYSLKSLPLL